MLLHMSHKPWNLLQFNTFKVVREHRLLCFTQDFLFGGRLESTLVTAGRLTGSARPGRLAVSADVNKQRVRLSGGSRGTC